MDRRESITDDRAVSQVIGVTLMITATVVISAVMATFVLGLGDPTETVPDASFGAEYDATGGGVAGGELTITHTGGQRLDPSQIFVHDSNGSGESGSWSHLDGSVNSNSVITAACSVDVAITRGETIRIVWSSSETGRTSILFTYDPAD